MTTTEDMLDTFAGEIGIDKALLARTLDALAACTRTCTQCADACLAEDANAMRRCIRTDLDCADVCNAALRVLGRQTEYDADMTRAVLEACATACGICAEECESHAEMMEHCRICAEACRECESACREVLAAIS